MRNVFGDGRMDPKYSEVLESLRIIIISVHETKKQTWIASEFFKSCTENQINIEFLQMPCTAKAQIDGNTGQSFFREVELKHACTPSFWKKVLESRQADTLGWR